MNATTDPSNTIQWRRNGTDIAGATNNTLTASDAGAYTARVTSSTGCAATSNAVQVTVRPNSASTVSASICQGQSYSFGSQSLTSAGTYNRTVTSANGCDSVITLNLTVTLPPPPSGLACFQTSTYNSTTCSYDISGTPPPPPTNLACYQSANFDSVTCTWIISGTPNPIIVTTVSVCDTNYNWSVSSQSYSTSGTYYFTSNCQDYELRLTLNIPAVITSQPINQTINQYNSTTFSVGTLASSGITNSYTFTWQRSINNGPFMNISNNALFSGTNTSTLVVNALTTSLNQNRFRCVVSSSCGIPATSTTAILDVIPGNPNSLSIPVTTICPNVNNSSLSIPIVANAFTDVAAMTFDLKLSSGITFTGISNMNSSLSGLNSNVINGKIRISWFSQNNITVPNGTELFKLNITASGPGAIEWDSIYQFFFDEYNGERLTNVSNGSINTFPSITPTITPLNSICENASPITLIANPSGGVFSGLGVVNGQFDPSFTGAGFHNITYTYTTNQGCSFSTTTSLFVSALPSGNAGSDVEICPGSSVVLSATGGTSYMWSNGIATAVNPVSPMFTTVYTVNIFNASGCFITDTVLVTVSSGNGIQIAAGDSISICYGDSITLNTNGATQAIWYPANGLSSMNSLNPVANPSVTTTY
ncbi:MAG: hypothetical protein ACKOAV_11880 [Bacteroidota bacterium]